MVILPALRELSLSISRLLWLIHVDTCQKTIKFCKAIILQIKYTPPHTKIQTKSHWSCDLNFFYYKWGRVIKQWRRWAHVHIADSQSQDKKTTDKQYASNTSSNLFWKHVAFYFSFFKLNFTMFQVYSIVIQLYAYIYIYIYTLFFIFCSFLDYYKILNIVPHAI